LKPLDTYRKELHDAVAAVEAEIEAHRDQIEALNLRLQGISRAIELCVSDQSAIIEVLQATVTDGNPRVIIMGEAASKPISSRKLAQAAKPGARALGRARLKQPKRGVGKAKPAGGLKRVDMIAELLSRRPGLSTRELVTALGNDFGWTCTERNVTAHLYTNRRFVRGKADRSGKQVVTWSLK